MEMNKSYEVKEWFASKVAQEIKCNITRCEVFAVMKETEKAVYAMLNLGCEMRKCMWVPKSVLVALEVGEDEFGKHHHETRFIEDYDEAVAAFKRFWSLYR